MQRMSLEEININEITARREFPRKWKVEENFKICEGKGHHVYIPYCLLTILRILICSYM